jgi:hypothetical protein
MLVGLACDLTAKHHHSLPKLLIENFGLEQSKNKSPFISGKTFVIFQFTKRNEQQITLFGQR